MEARSYEYRDAAPAHTSAYLLPTVKRLLEANASPGAKLFELGCGNGANAAVFASWGYDVVAVDPSESGISIARKSFPTVRFETASAYDDLSARYGTFDAVVSLEVIEHLYSPRLFAGAIHSLLSPGGVTLISTPYHGYLKNLALALTGKLDGHFTALWDHGHIKFWSAKTLRTLLEEASFRVERFERIGRIPPFAKSMIAVARRSPR